MLSVLVPWPALLLAAVEQPPSVEVEISGVRNDKGWLHVCMTRNISYFPDCARDPSALRQTVPAAARQVRFASLPPGRYAITMFHDENTNKRLDKLLGVPREGFGFSRNPAIRFGPPRFEQVELDVGPGMTRTSVRLQYLL